MIEVGVKVVVESRVEVGVRVITKRHAAFKGSGGVEIKSIYS